jgi:HlyD family secretion protein
MKRIILLSVLPFLFSCHSKTSEFDAAGSFEADEVVVSSQANGQLLEFSVNEGDSLAR